MRRLTRFGLAASLLIMVVGITGVTPSGASASSTYYMGVNQANANSGDQVWSQWVYVYYSNNNPSSVTLDHTSQWVRLDSRTSSSCWFYLDHEVSDGGPLLEQDYDEHCFAVGEQQNFRWNYPFYTSGGGKTYYKSGGRPIRVYSASYPSEPTYMNHWLYFWPGSTCHYVNYGFAVSGSGPGSTC